MKKELLALLRCPKTGQSLMVEKPPNSPEDKSHTSKVIDEIRLVTGDRKNSYPVIGSIPRFVPRENYADNFGMQWNLFAKTQLDSASGQKISEKRFWSSTKWNPADLKGAWVLDVGCGSGRFAEIALNAGANVVALDYSSAVDACHANLQHYPNFHVVQGDIYSLPFAPASFKFVYSLGVLQHTPDVARAFACLPDQVALGGYICVDYYEKMFISYLWPKYWLRPLTKRMDQEKLFSLIKFLVPKLMPFSRFISRIPKYGALLKHLVPVANLEGTEYLSPQQLNEWAILDTFDMFAPAYDKPQTRKTVRRWLARVELEDVEVFRAGHLVATARKKAEI